MMVRSIFFFELAEILTPATEFVEQTVPEDFAMYADRIDFLTIRYRCAFSVLFVTGSPSSEPEVVALYSVAVMSKLHLLESKNTLIIV